MRDKYRSLPEEKKIKRENTERTGIIIYMPKEKKQGLTEYQKNYREAKKIILKKKLLSIMRKTKEL